MSYAPVAQLDRVPPSEGGGCPFEPGREHESGDEWFIRRAMALAQKAADAGDVPIGAVLAIGDRTFEAYNEKERRPDPTAHAELIAIRQAARELRVWRLGGTLYVTKEPCPMCAGAIAAARIERLVFGCPDPKGGAVGSVIDVLSSPAVNHRVLVTAGVLEAQTARQLRQYFQAKRTAERPASDRRSERCVDDE